jgi:hypothetical protein
MSYKKILKNVEAMTVAEAIDQAPAITRLRNGGLYDITEAMAALEDVLSLSELLSLLRSHGAASAAEDVEDFIGQLADDREERSVMDGPASRAWC